MRNVYFVVLFFKNLDLQFVNILKSIFEYSFPNVAEKGRNPAVGEEMGGNAR